ncbi:class I SAM-dependent methyltransferase [Rhizobium sp. RU36D]|uniref:class I SAM-dependent methyltransferase n=1 Tax=Rhizobium sp. RU36D TaxID=1907415 RepID=UPI0009D815DB|nr:class I SAM-dependent methyltransferase [Rhizobium sp. RU36D]SMD04705.1 Methyltransferase domain-containing protein [Rhizobium sp. RU36D]
MPAGPDATLQFYAGEAQTYARRGRKAQLKRLMPFCDRLPAGGRILELGCGAGEDGEAMLKLGFDVSPTDGTPELAALAQQRLGRPVRVLRFEDISEIEAYDGVWACACLLHVPRADLSGVLALVRRALRPAGWEDVAIDREQGSGYDGEPTDWLHVTAVK